MKRNRTKLPTAKTAAHTTTSLSRLIWRKRAPLAPILGTGVTLAAGGLLYAAIELEVDPLYLAAAGSTAALTAAAAIVRLDPALRPIATAATIAGASAAIAIGLDPTSPATHLGTWAASSVLSAWWWLGSYLPSLKAEARLQRKGDTLIRKLSLGDDTRILSAAKNTDGSRTWDLHLGDNADASVVKAARVAHLLNLNKTRVMISPDADSPRRLQIKILNQNPEQTAPAVHPALAVNAMAPGGPWAPGSRSIHDPLPFGVARADGEQVNVLLSQDNDVLHVLLVGLTGGGKSVSVANIITAVAACHNAVIAGVDIVKSGVTFKVFTPVLEHLLTGSALDPDNLINSGNAWLAELEGLTRLCARRNELMANGDIRDEEGDMVAKWPATSENPNIVYVIEELSSTLNQIAAVDAPLKMAIQSALDALSQIARSAGIHLAIVTQRPDFTQISTALRSQISQIICHKLKSKKDLMGQWSSHDIDPVGPLAAVKGSAFVGAPDGTPILQRAYNLSAPKTCQVIAATYGPYRPHLTPEELRMVGWPAVESIEGTATTTIDDRMPDMNETAPKHMSDRDTIAALTQQMNDRRDAAYAWTPAQEAPRPDFAGVELERPIVDDPEDDGADAIILEALAEDSLTLPQVMDLLETAGFASSKASAVRRINALLRLDRITREGKGRATKYALPEPELVLTA